MVAPSTSCRPTEYCQWRRCCGFVVAIREGRTDRASWVGRGGSLNGTETAKRESETGAAAAKEVAEERSAVDRSQDSTASCGMVKGLGRLGGRIGERVFAAKCQVSPESRTFWSSPKAETPARAPSSVLAPCMRA